jgi:cytidine deaminase
MENDFYLKKLKEVRNKALAIYSNFKVGALLIDNDGQLFTGFNIESSSYGLTICAERVVLFKALSEGARDFKRLYILANKNDFCPPCGACRQILFEYAPDLEVILLKESGEQKIYTLRSLLPYAFSNLLFDKKNK